MNLPKKLVHTKNIFPSIRHASRRQRGFTLLLAALIASIVLSIGTSIYEIAQKEVSLSSLGKNSEFAFYSADTGAECGLYWDMRFQSFATSTAVASPPIVTCDAQTVHVTYVDNSIGSPWTSSTFSFEYSSNKDPIFAPAGYCTDVTVTKSVDKKTVGVIDTVITSNGYSTPCAIVATSPVSLQRTVQLNY